MLLSRKREVEASAGFGWQAMTSKRRECMKKQASGAWRNLRDGPKATSTYFSAKHYSVGEDLLIARCPVRVEPGIGEPFAERPLCPDERTSSDRADWSVSCHFRTYAAQLVVRSVLQHSPHGQKSSALYPQDRDKTVTNGDPCVSAPRILPRHSTPITERDRITKPGQSLSNGRRAQPSTPIGGQTACRCTTIGIAIRLPLFLIGMGQE